MSPLNSRSVFTEDTNQVNESPFESPLQPSLGDELQLKPEDTPVIVERKPWGVAGAVGTWIFSVLALLIVPLVVVIPYFIYLIVNKHPPTAEAIASDKTFLWLSIIGVIPAHVLTFAVVWAV